MAQLVCLRLRPAPLRGQAPGRAQRPPQLGLAAAQAEQGADAGAGSGRAGGTAGAGAGEDAPDAAFEAWPGAGAAAMARTGWQRPFPTHLSNA